MRQPGWSDFTANHITSRGARSIGSVKRIMSAAQQKPEPTLRDIISHLAALEQQVANLSEKMDAWVAELGTRLDAMEHPKEREPPAFPGVADAWEAYLPELFGALLAPPLVPVCARLLVGMRAKEIASELGRPLTTVKSQIAAIRERFNVASTEEIPPYVFHRFWDLYALGSPKSWRKLPEGR